MVGGTVIENALDRQPETGRVLRRLWCADSGDECAVWADPDEAADVRPGDRIWWQSREIMWHRQDDPETEIVIEKIGYSFDPHRSGEATP